jgi:hypothetical protein
MIHLPGFEGNSIFRGLLGPPLPKEPRSGFFRKVKRERGHAFPLTALVGISEIATMF